MSGATRGGTLPGLRSLADKVDPRHAAVVVIDVQNDFCADDGFFGRQGYGLEMIQQAARTTVGFVEKAKAAGVRVVYIRSTYDDHFLNDPMRERNDRRDLGPRLLEGTPGTGFYLVKPASGDPVVTKHRYSAFQNTELDIILRAWGIRSLIIAGVTTNVCVESTAREAYFQDYHVVVLEDCTGTHNENRDDLTAEGLHRGSLTNIGLTFGVVSSSAEVAKIWEASETG